jgi:8-oxo-dGTP pyrophosphatase MutT (NUDIX family)
MTTPHTGPLADARAVLSTWHAPTTQQAALAQEYLAHLTQHEDGLLRACLPNHLTASALIIDPHHGNGPRVLLTLHRRLHKWLQTGGHIDPTDVSLAAAALREATEESGIGALRLSSEPILLDQHAVTCSAGPAVHLDVQYLAVAPADAAFEMSEESIDLAWFEVDALPNDADLSVRALVHAAVRHLNA